MKLYEMFEDDDEETKYDNLPSSETLNKLKPHCAAIAQKVYDSWIQDEDDDLNGGGICHLIADEISSIVNNAGIPCASQTASDVQHVYCVAQCNNGIFEIDIPYWLYERGGGFTWEKLPNIMFSSDNVNIHLLDHDPARMNIYVDEWEED
jgi:hypothetical protein